jgi:hypothetical protein
MRERSIVLIDPGDQFLADEAEEIVGAADLRVPLAIFRLLSWRRKITVAVGVRDSDDEHFRNSPVSCKEFGCAGRVFEIAAAVKQKQDWIVVVARLVARWFADNQPPRLIKNLRLQLDSFTDD